MRWIQEAEPDEIEEIKKFFSKRSAECEELAKSEWRGQRMGLELWHLEQVKKAKALLEDGIRQIQVSCRIVEFPCCLWVHDQLGYHFSQAVHQVNASKQNIKLRPHYLVLKVKKAQKKQYKEEKVAKVEEAKMHAAREKEVRGLGALNLRVPKSYAVNAFVC